MQGHSIEAVMNTSLNRSPAWRRIMSFYKYLKPGIWVMRQPVIGPVLQKAWIREHRDANWILPVNEAIPRGRQAALPGIIVEQLLRASDGIFSMAACPCRTAYQCANHPRNLGCLHIGPAVRQIPADVGRLLSLEEGLQHLELAQASNLIPTILYNPSEAEIFKVDKQRMLSICFCCECCCDVRLLLRRGPERYWNLYNQRLPGLEILVGAGCTLCGDCVRACYGGDRIIQMGKERAEISDRCIGCGRCVSACLEGALSIRVQPDSELQVALFKKITDRVKFGSDNLGGV
jgi:UDP-glucose 4-epimerase